jgi:hypothetical protein
MSAIDYTKAYITHNDGTSLATIDENNNFVDLGTFVDSGGTALSKVYGLAFGKDGEIYLTQQNGGSNETFSGTDTQIWKANLPAVGGEITLTKVGTGLGVYGENAINTHAMDIGPDGSMYILDFVGNIFTVDLSTGLASFVATTVIEGTEAESWRYIKNSMDIVFDANFTLYAQGAHPAGGSRLFTINTSTGAATSIGTFSESNIMGLWSNLENTIYATKYSNWGNLYTVNPATAALTLVGDAGAYGDGPHGGDLWIAYGGWPGSDPPVLSSATYNASNGALVITGTNLPAYAGATNDIDISKLTLTGEGGNTYTLASNDVELTSTTEFSLTLNAADQLQLAGLFNKNGTSSRGGTTYNIAAADDWAPGADSSTNIADLTGNAITVSNFVNVAPSGTNKTITINEDRSHTYASSDFGFSDSNGDALSAVIVSTLPAAGGLTLDGSAVSANDSIPVADINASKLIFTPGSNGNGSGYTSFTFQVKDDGGTANSGVDTDPSANTITIDVNAVNDAPTGSVTISGTAREGQTLTAANTLADADGLGTITNQWKRAGAAISGATSSTYELVQADVGSAISVTASYTDGQGTAESVSSSATSAVANVNDAPTGSVTISGTAREGETLTAANTLADVDGLGTIAYGWNRAGAAISGATSNSYELVQADVGSAISVTASYTDGQGTAESVTSSATSAVKALPVYVPPSVPEEKKQVDENPQITDADDSLLDQADVNLRMMGGNDYVEITGGINNFANGNQGDDLFILRAGQEGQYLGGKGADTFEVFGGIDAYANGQKGADQMTLRGGLGRYLGGDDGDRIEVLAAVSGSSVNGNRGEDTIIGSVAGVTYRGGADADLMIVSQGDVYGDKGADTFRGVKGEGYAVIRDYTIGEDVVDLDMEGSWSRLESGLMFTDDSGDQIMLLVGINDLEQVTLI